MKSKASNGTTEIVVLENVLGFLAVLGKVLALIRRNIAGYLAYYVAFNVFFTTYHFAFFTFCLMPVNKGTALAPMC